MRVEEARRWLLAGGCASQSQPHPHPQLYETDAAVCRLEPVFRCLESFIWDLNSSDTMHDPLTQFYFCYFLARAAAKTAAVAATAPRAGSRSGASFSRAVLGSGAASAGSASDAGGSA